MSNKIQKCMLEKAAESELEEKALVEGREGFAPQMEFEMNREPMNS